MQLLRVSPSPFLRKNVILGELNETIVQECDSKGVGGGGSWRGIPEDWVSRLDLWGWATGEKDNEEALRYAENSGA